MTAPTPRTHIRFRLNDREVREEAVAASDTLLDFLRLEKRLTGSKEGCAEGDCGACTVLVGRLVGGDLVYEPVNACIRFLASLDGCHVVTIEHLRGANGALHPVQKAMVEHHGSQCGFCTPGIVMALYALWMRVPNPTRREVEVALQGNLCRCTGYRPIIDAAMSVEADGEDFLAAERDAVTAELLAWREGARVEVSRDGSRAILPGDVDDLAAVLEAEPEARVIAGATDVGLWVTKHLRALPVAVFIGHLEGLKEIEESDAAVRIGSGVTYAEAEGAMGAAFPHLAPYFERIAGWQVRSMGTIGGNIANGSPIGDMPPVLIAMGATITLRKSAARREIALEDFFVDYGKQDRAPGEFVEAITVPKTGGLHAAYKVSKRRDEDISTVAAGVYVRVEDGQITAARIAYGGMAAVPKRAMAAEAALVGQPFGAAAFEAAARALAGEFTPLSDMRASAEYRMRVAQNLLRRFWIEQGTDGEAAA
ncbi:xanthine dehydrogenase small subunit [Shimia sp. FJ5]|uniref:xanthine dehydrogenase small subunit n=1 Tax=Shimia sp. FJ5 TaxID=3079054 RepID=UPI0026239217|nr:xanthine dehydrogenase small subunit [Shimia sp. FJ5]MDV4143641.1 xanthine dehydrogenase small subunit [Shimia sp. FJ5]